MSRTISMLWATGSHSVFEVVCLSLPWSLLPCRYFTSLKAVFPSVPACNWGIAAIVVQWFKLNCVEFCDKLHTSGFTYVSRFKSCHDVNVHIQAKTNDTNSWTDTYTIYCTERCDNLICIAVAWARMTFSVGSVHVMWIVICVWLMTAASPMRCLNTELICLFRP